jgi:hypothetical protein
LLKIKVNEEFHQEGILAGFLFLLFKGLATDQSLFRVLAAILIIVIIHALLSGTPTTSSLSEVGK